MKIDNLTNHFHANQNDMKKMGSDIINLHNKVETYFREHEHDKDGLFERLKHYEAFVNEIKEETSEHQDTFMITIESKLEEFDRKLMNIDKDNRINTSHITALEQNQQFDKSIENLRTDTMLEIKRLETRLNNIDHFEQVNSKSLKDIQSQVANIEKAGHTNWHELYDKINNANKNLADLQSQQNVVKVQKTRQVSQSPVGDPKNIEGRIGRLETIAVRHGKVLDDLTSNASHTSDNTPVTIIKEKTYSDHFWRIWWWLSE